MMSVMLDEPAPVLDQGAHDRRRSRLRIAAPKALAWKSVILLVTTLAFVPILLWQHELAASVYVGALVLVHVVGLGVLIARSGDWWKDKRALGWRLGGIALLTVLLAIVGKGLTGTTGGLFWGTLGLVWVLHTAGAVLLHLRGEARSCPFF